MQDNSFYYIPYKPVGIRPHKILFFSVCVTLALYIFIPLIDQIGIIKADLELKNIQTVNVLYPKPFKKEPLKLKRTPKKQLPKLIKVRPQYQPMPVNISLDMDIDVYNGDFSLNFNLQPEIDINNFVFEMNDIDLEPRPLLQLPPFYPLRAKSQAIEGSVTLMFVVNIQGFVENIEVMDSQNGQYFIEPAIKAVKKWRFMPGKKQGKAVPVRVQLPLNFDIKS